MKACNNNVHGKFCTNTIIHFQLIFFRKIKFCKKRLQKLKTSCMLRRKSTVVLQNASKNFQKLPCCSHAVVSAKFYMHFLRFCEKWMQYQRPSKTSKYPRPGNIFIIILIILILLLIQSINEVFFKILANHDNSESLVQFLLLHDWKPKFPTGIRQNISRSSSPCDRKLVALPTSVQPSGDISDKNDENKSWIGAEIPTNQANPSNQAKTRWSKSALWATKHTNDYFDPQKWMYYIIQEMCGLSQTSVCTEMSIPDNFACRTLGSSRSYVSITKIAGCCFAFSSDSKKIVSYNSEVTKYQFVILSWAS